MISEPVVIVSCDICGEFEEVRLTAVGRGWDDRNVEIYLTSNDWTIVENGDTYCPSCSDDRREKEEEHSTEWKGG
jgi:hypothetical protein